MSPTFFSQATSRACPSETSYPDQTTECQQTIDGHRVAVYLPVAFATVVFLLCVILTLLILT